MIKGFHAHVYFNQDSLERARALCLLAASTFEVQMGRVHQQPVGPHTEWSCQLAFKPEVFGEIIPWLALNHGDLVVFIHPLTGNALVDHRDRAIWIGGLRPLILTGLSEES